MSDATPSIDLSTPTRALAIGAHSDDVEFGCGATLAKWAAAGADVHLLVLTDGSKGTWDPEADLRALVELRRTEQREAAVTLGLAGVEFLDFVDGELESGLPARALVCEEIRRRRPDVVVGHDPWKRHRVHPDHRHAGWLTIDAVVAARDPHFFPEQRLAPHRPRQMLLFEADEVDHLERVDGYVDVKIAALFCHRSQWRSTMAIEPGTPQTPAQRDAFAARIRAEVHDAGRDARAGPAEAFKLLGQL